MYIFFLILSLQGYSQDSINQFEALRFKNQLGFQKPYRVLKTTFKSLEGFQTYYPGTNITLEKILRYHLYTAIYINQKENKLFSMDLTEFQLKALPQKKKLQRKQLRLSEICFLVQMNSNQYQLITNYLSLF